MDSGPSRSGRANRPRGPDAPSGTTPPSEPAEPNPQVENRNRNRSNSVSLERMRRRVMLALVMVVAVWMGMVAGSEWSFSSGDEYVTAFLNTTWSEGAKLHTDKSEVGKFSGGGRVGPASGVLVHVRTKNGASHYGCEFPFENESPQEPWVALVKRGKCNFDTKVENAFRSNASAVVVYDKNDSDLLEKMGVKQRNITAVFTFKWKGEEMAALVDNGTRVMLYLTVGNHCTRPYGNINRTSVLFVSISFVVLMIILLAWLVFYYIQRFRYLHAKDRLARRLCSAAKKAISKIPTRSMKAGDKEVQGEGECCAVCIEPYRAGDVVRSLPCKHQFHKACVDPWLLEHRTCPMCKMDILKYYGFVYTGSQESILQVEFEEDRMAHSEGSVAVGVRESDSLQPRMSALSSPSYSMGGPAGTHTPNSDMAPPTSRGTSPMPHMGEISMVPVSMMVLYPPQSSSSPAGAAMTTTVAVPTPPLPPATPPSSSKQGANSGSEDENYEDEDVESQRRQQLLAPTVSPTKTACLDDSQC